MKKSGMGASWMKLSAYQAFQYGQLGLIISKKQKRGRYLVLKPLKLAERKILGKPNSRNGTKR